MGGVEDDAVDDCAVANAQGWRTRKGQPWTARQVLHTLTNHVYAGLVIDGYGFRDGCHTIRKGSVIYRYYRCRSTAGGRPPCKGVLVSAPEIETVVLQAVGLEQTGLTSKEAETALRAALQQVVFKADTGRIEVLFRPAGNAPASPPGDGISDEA